MGWGFEVSDQPRPKCQPFRPRPDTILYDSLLFSLHLMLCSCLPLLLAHFNLFLAMGPVTATVSQLSAHFLLVVTLFLPLLFLPTPHPSQKIAQCFCHQIICLQRYFPSLLRNRGQQLPDPSQLIKTFPLLHDQRLLLFTDLEQRSSSVESSCNTPALHFL